MVVALGDSITNGVGSSDGTNGRWPGLPGPATTARTATRPPPSSTRASATGCSATGPAWAERPGPVQPDILDQPGVRDVIVLEVSTSVTARTPIGCERDADVSAAQIINGYKILIADAHSHGVRIFGCTLTPFGSSWFWSVEGQAKWRAINHWIRTSGAFDGVFDFARAISDPRDRNDLNPADDSGDGLHPNDAGYAAMANSINLNSLTQ